MADFGKDFASLMQGEAGKDRRTGARLRPGQAVSGTVVQVGKEYVFVDVGSTVEGRIDRRELEDAQGELSIRPGDKLQASVVQGDDGTGPLLSVSLGRGRRRGLDTTALENAQRAQLPVEGVVGKAVKGGVEVSLGGVRAFCPASQLYTEFVQDLGRFEGQTLSFLVVEVKGEGRDVVVSRRALLEQEQAQKAQGILAQLQVGGDYPATVSALQKYGAFVDLGGGLEGLIHISELSHGRVDRVEDLLAVGEGVTVRVLAIEPPEKKGAHPRLRLSLKALTGAPAEAGAKPGASEVLEGTVSKLTLGGVIVDTPKGSGLVPVRELGIPRQADFRRVFPVGKQVTVVLMNRDNSRGLTFSIARVASVQERANYQEFTRAMSGTSTPQSNLGSFGALLRQELNLPEPAPNKAEPEPPTLSSPAAPPAPVRSSPDANSGASVSGASPWREFVDQSEAERDRAQSGARGKPSKGRAPAPPEPAPPKAQPPGIIRRQKPAK